jgi:cytoskeletal protein RodZ
MDIGRRLREARHQRGRTVEDIAASTKVSRQTIDHIEHNRFARLPGGILTRGYLRAYAAELGLDPEPIVDDYRVQCFGDAGEELPIVRPPPVERESHPGRTLVVEILVLACAAAVYQLHRSAAELPVPVPSPSTDAVHAADERVSPAPAVLHKASVASERRLGIRVEIEPTGPCWVSATADQEVVIHQLLQRGDRAVATASEELVLRVGDPATFSYWLNGVPGRPLGPPGEPVTIHVTADNYERFLNATGLETSAPATSTT